MLYIYSFLMTSARGSLRHVQGWLLRFDTWLSDAKMLLNLPLSTHPAPQKSIEKKEETQDHL